MIMNRSLRPNLFLLGDSITQFSMSTRHIGWGSLLADYFEGRRVDIVNRGFSGYNSRWVLQMLPTIAPINLIQTSMLTTIFLGANDSVLEGHSQHVALEEYRLNITEIVQHIRTINKSIVIILITPPPVDHITWANQMIPGAETGRHNNQVSTYAQVIRELSTILNTNILDLWEEGSDYKIEFEDLCDGS